ncbi:hypothetical protein HYH03_001537 [Edaphochlamys debaryana]|uniref:Uncharacterized protein n=1 Tax=Edaphochlamys debaryana TaxID=47281 RepID=A0A835YDA9_9CHLO|nr:hypothetical protein HYH03_001537 [Edaphochlamys debaryana]|eukprot:KAG2500775.1 hypothetical protein HYH03_001537 [Edaphochlamys debaryana]
MLAAPNEASGGCEALLLEAFGVGSAVDVALPASTVTGAAVTGGAGAAAGGSGPSSSRAPDDSMTLSARRWADGAAFWPWRTGSRVVGVASGGGAGGRRYKVALPCGAVEGPDGNVMEVEEARLRPAASGQPGAPADAQSALETAGVPVLKRGLLLQQFRRGGWRPALVLAASKDHTAASGGRTWAELRQHLPPAPRKASPPKPNAPRSEGDSSWSGWPWAKAPAQLVTAFEAARTRPPGGPPRAPRVAWAGRPSASQRTAGQVADVHKCGDASYVNALPPLPARGGSQLVW